MSQTKPGAVSRRSVLGAAVAIGAGALAACDTRETHRQAEASPTAADAADQIVSFHGRHQAGVVTPAQGYLTFTSFDVAGDPHGLRAMLNSWSAAAVAMTQGQQAPEVLGPPTVTDSGETVGASPARLTVTIGYGSDVFSKAGLASRRPAALRPLPHFSNDNLNPALGGGDIGVQICADDAQVAYHAGRQLMRLTNGVTSQRWSRSGFRGPQLGNETKPLTRNLFGFHDGIHNPSLTDEPTLQNMLWIQPADGPAWMVDGTYLVTRRINLFTDGWDDLPANEQEAAVGRRKISGTPLSGGTVASPLNLAQTGSDGSPAIPINAHVRLAAAASNHGATILRRSYAYYDTSPSGQQAGQLFCAFQRNPDTGFVPIQRQLAAADALNPHTQHIGSALFAIPPGLQPGQGWGDQLFGFPSAG